MPYLFYFLAAIKILTNYIDPLKFTRINHKCFSFYILTFGYVSRNLSAVSERVVIAQAVKNQLGERRGGYQK